MDQDFTKVTVREEPLVLPTYEPLPPDRNPMFLEKRVYQGSSGKVYPLPFYDRISDTKTERAWKSIQIENEYIHVTLLPEIGGRVHAIRDKTNDYDLIYNQKVIKPALVGLAGPWISGGIEFNWPQHHRPATYMPVQTHIEHGDDGSVTVWMSDHDPMDRMKGMHGICLRPGSSVVELKARLYNRTPFTRTFLWWANVATKVHELYQSFFPPDVFYVADHAKRATSRYPHCDDKYYGVDYGQRGREGIPASELPSQFVPRKGLYSPDDLSWYANIPVPTSYMCMGSKHDFFGGYDHRERAGIVHIANHHISPGKKQWTWGNHEFGYAWDRNLTEADADGVYHPYIEIMAGVFTDNQPDFSFLAPGETRAFSQFWYPLREIGPAQQANVNAAVSLRVEKNRAKIGVHVSRTLPDAIVKLLRDGKEITRFERTLDPESSLLEAITLPQRTRETQLCLIVTSEGREIIRYQPVARVESPLPPAATEPATPSDVSGVDELYLTGMHLTQYRHATRSPVDYWQEALRRDTGDSRCNTAMGQWHLARGEFSIAERFFRTALARLTHRNPNPADGEAYYGLGLTLRYMGRDADACDALYKSTWNQAWQSAAFHALAEIDAIRGDWQLAADHLRKSLATNTDNLRARNLLAIALRHLGDNTAADAILAETLSIDPLDAWARQLRGEWIGDDASIHLDIAIDYARAGLFADAVTVLQAAKPAAVCGLAPMLALYEAHYSMQHRLLPPPPVLRGRAGVGAGSDETESSSATETAPTLTLPGSTALTAGRSTGGGDNSARLDLRYCFPHRLEDQLVLEWAAEKKPTQFLANYLLGCLLYDKRRYDEAITRWENAARRSPKFATVWRNLGIAYFNVLKNPAKAKKAYQTAFACDKGDARVLYERDQLWKRLGESPRKRLRDLENHLPLVEQRDDLSVELCALYNQTGQHAKAEQIIRHRQFQPWEGGEGQALGQHVRTFMGLARIAERNGDLQTARKHLEFAIQSPRNLGEACHLLANQSDIHFELGRVCRAMGNEVAAVKHLTAAADFRGDFVSMSVQSYSEKTYFSALAARLLGRSAEAKKLLTGLAAHARALRKTKATIDYFATSLPTMLLFDDDLQMRQTRQADLMEAQASIGLGQRSRGKRLLEKVLKADPNHAMAADLLAELD